MADRRKRYPLDYVRNVASMVLDSYYSIAHVADTMGLNAGMVTRWVEEEQHRREIERLEAQTDETLRRDNERLRRENDRLKMELEFVGKAAAFFSEIQAPQSDLP